MDVLPLAALESDHQFLVADGLVAFLLLEALGGPIGFLLLALRLLMKHGAVIMVTVLPHNLALDGGGLGAQVVHFFITKNNKNDKIE